MSSVTQDRRNGVIASKAVKVPCACCATSNINIQLGGEQTIDGVLTAASRVLLTAQTTTTENGLYDSSTGAWTRCIDFDGALDAVKGTLINVVGGTNNVGFWYVTTAGTLVADGTMTINFGRASLVLATISAYVQGLLNAVNQAAYLTAAGFSTFFQTFIAVTNAAAFRLLLLIPQTTVQQTDNFFTTTGTAPNFVLTPTVDVGVPVLGDRYSIKFHANGAGSDMLNVSGHGNMALMKYTSSGTKTAFAPVSGMLTDIEHDGTNWVVLDQLPTSGSGAAVIAGVRQSVISGPIDSNGQSSFGGATGSTTVTMTGTLIATAAQGYTTTGGCSDVVGSGTNLSWTGLATNGVMYLYVDIISGALTAGAGTLAPAYQEGGAYSATAGQLTFNIQQMNQQVAQVQSARVYVGQVTVSSNVVSAIVWYALNGRYKSPLTAVQSTGTMQNFNHNLGIYPNNVELYIQCISSDKGYGVGARVKPGTAATESLNPIVNVTPLAMASIGPSTIFDIPSASTGSAVDITTTSWNQIMSASRGWGESA